MLQACTNGTKQRRNFTTRNTSLQCRGKGGRSFLELGKSELDQTNGLHVLHGRMDIEVLGV